MPHMPHSMHHSRYRLLDTWTPEPLVPVLTEKEEYIVNNTPIITGFKADSVIVEGVAGPVLNVSAFDFLGNVLCIVYCV